jgi:hypothetical protein
MQEALVAHGDSGRHGGFIFLLCKMTICENQSCESTPGCNTDETGRDESITLLPTR